MSICKDHCGISEQRFRGARLEAESNWQWGGSNAAERLGPASDGSVKASGEGCDICVATQLGWDSWTGVVEMRGWPGAQQDLRAAGTGHEEGSQDEGPAWGGRCQVQPQVHVGRRSRHELVIVISGGV